MRDSLTGALLGSGFVILEDAAGSEVARELVSYAGRFTVRAPGPGRYRLRWARIGYRTVISGDLDLAAGAAVPYVFRVVPMAVQLGAIEVRGKRRCDARPANVEETAAVWAEVQKALEATEWSDRQSSVRYTWYSFVREWNPNRRELQDEQGRTQRALTSRPFSTVEPERLAAEGYVVERVPDVWYYLPDANTLLDDTFLDTHCFWVTRDERERPGQIGLAFEPAPGRTVADVVGALWIDEGTLQLRELAVTYVNLPWDFRDERVGGTVRFLMLPSGAWVVREWEIRTPVLDTREVGDMRMGWRRQVVLRGFRDTGGRVVEVTAARGAVVYSTERAYVEGTVFDSTTRAPLANAQVRIAGTDVTDRTDAAGHFELSAPLEGAYRVAVSHPWLDSIGFRGPWNQVDLAPGVIRPLTIGVPHADSIASRLCDGQPPDAETRVVLGVVRGADDAARAVSGVVVSASWQTVGWSDAGQLTVHGIRQDVLTDEDGFFALCAVPQAVPVTIAAQADSAEIGTAHVVLPRTAGGTLLLSQGGGWDQPYAGRATGAARTIRVDLSPASGETRRGPSAVMAGIVVDRLDGRLLDSATVVVNDRDTIPARIDGTFGQRVAWRAGDNRVVVSRPGYEPLALDLSLEDPDAEVAVRLAVAPTAAVRLAAVEVVGAAVDRGLQLVGFYRRRDIGLGRFVEQAEIEQRRRGAQSWVDLLRGVPGVNVLPNPVGFGYVPVVSGMLSARGEAGGGTGCTVPRIYVDGRVAFDPDPARDMSELYDAVSGAAHPQDVVAIEVYRRPAEVPAEYSGAQSGCGTILVWTGRGVSAQLPPD